MQDDIKPPAQDNLPAAAEDTQVQSPPLEPEVNDQSFPQEESNPDPSPQPQQDANKQTGDEVSTPNLPGHKSEHHIVPIILAIIILVLLAAVAIVSGNR